MEMKRLGVFADPIVTAGPGTRNEAETLVHLKKEIK